MKEKKKKIIINEKTQQANRIDWVIGFAEGDGCFYVSKSNPRVLRQEFIITQKDPKVLYKVKQFLGFGRVESHGAYFRYIVGDIQGTKKIIDIFNGNLCLYKTHARFTRYVETFNLRISLKKYQSLAYQPIHVKEKKQVHFDSAWFSGLIDAEGCFSTVITAKTKQLRFAIDQKDEKELMERIKIALGGGSFHVRKTTNFRFQYFHVRPDEQDPLVQYLEKYPLQSEKYIDYVRWKTLRYHFLNGEHLESQSLERLQGIKESLSRGKQK